MSNLHKDQLTAQLINTITGLEINSNAGKQALRKAKYTLTYEKCINTSESKVNESLNGIAEKFKIKGHEHLSKQLLIQKERLLDTRLRLGRKSSNQTDLKYDLLRLLLCLSSSANRFQYILATETETTNDQPLTWEDIIRDDPLEGDHWKQWRDSASNDSCTDDDASQQSEDMETYSLQREQGKTNQTYISNIPTQDYTDRIKYDKRTDHHSLNNILSQQYWQDDFAMLPEDSIEISLLQNPCQTSVALNTILYKDQIKPIAEADMTREVLSLLRGYEGVAFLYVDGRFQLDSRFYLQHLSRAALRSILEEFCHYGNMLSDLRQLVTFVSSKPEYGQTCQAFSTTLYKSLLDLEDQISDIEAKCGFITATTKQSISILNVRNMLYSSLKCFEAIYKIAVDVPFDISNACAISIYLIATFYDKALISQTSGNLIIYDTLLYILKELLVPYGQIIDEWIFYGSLIMDKSKEFYVSRNNNVQEDGPDYWSQGFTLEDVTVVNVCFPCPLFEQEVMSHIFFTGKAVNLLAQIEKTKKYVRLNHVLPVSFSAVIKEHLANKSPFITLKKTCSFHHEISVIDPFAAALFPLKNLKITETVESSYLSSTTDGGSLFAQDFSSFVENYISNPYNHTSTVLNQVLHKQCRLSEQLKSLSSIYLMLENDLMHSLCESLFNQMDNQETWFEERKMNDTFSRACETSGYDEIVYIKLKEVPIVANTVKAPTVASYLEFISFNVEIPWPLNNFIKQNELADYSKLISFLLRLKRAKYVMEKKTLFRGTSNRRKSDSYAMHFYAIRMKILWFINAFWRYIMTTILHSETLDFRYNLSISIDADDITALHKLYVRKIVDRCLLNDKAAGIKKSVISIFDMAEQMAHIFSTYMMMQNHGKAMEKRDLEQFNTAMANIEKDFNRENGFISFNLMILGKKANMPWFESLAASLSSQYAY